MLTLGAHAFRVDPPIRTANSRKRKRNNESPYLPRPANTVPRPENPVPRPPNSFFVFLADYRKGLVPCMDKITPQNTVCRTASILWQGLSIAQQQPYIDRAKEAKEDHRRKHPDYKYRPRCSEEKPKKKARRARAEPKPRVEATVLHAAPDPSTAHPDGRYIASVPDTSTQHYAPPAPVSNSCDLTRDWSHSAMAATADSHLRSDLCASASSTTLVHNPSSFAIDARHDYLEREHAQDVSSPSTDYQLGGGSDWWASTSFGVDQVALSAWSLPPTNVAPSIFDEQTVWSQTPTSPAASPVAYPSDTPSASSYTFEGNITAPGHYLQPEDGTAVPSISTWGSEFAPRPTVYPTSPFQAWAVSAERNHHIPPLPRKSSPFLPTPPNSALAFMSPLPDIEGEASFPGAAHSAAMLSVPSLSANPVTPQASLLTPPASVRVRTDLLPAVGWGEENGSASRVASALEQTIFDLGEGQTHCNSSGWYSGGLGLHT
jgi:hypothetical protein